MAEKHLRRTPQSPTKQRGCQAWYYEENAGVTIVVPAEWVTTTTATVTISWRRLRSALQRKDRNG